MQCQAVIPPVYPHICPDLHIILARTCSSVYLPWPAQHPSLYLFQCVPTLGCTHRWSVTGGRWPRSAKGLMECGKTSSFKPPAASFSSKSLDTCRWFWKHIILVSMYPTSYLQWWRLVSITLWHSHQHDQFQWLVWGRTDLQFNPKRYRGSSQTPPEKKSMHW